MSTPPARFQVSLDIFRGPLDLLLFLVRKHEVDILDIPIASITGQYLAYLEVLEQLDVNAVGDFLEMASTLVEIKSRMVLPGEPESEAPAEDPRQDLVRRLLEYKEYRDAATLLDERARAWQERFPRLASDAPAGLPRDPATEPLAEVELWDLVSAFGRLIREHHRLPASSIVYDETPIHVYMERIQAHVQDRGQAAFSELFEPGLAKSALVGIFLALLELVRHHRVRAEQSESFGEIWLFPGETDAPLDPQDVSDYEHRPRRDPAADDASAPWGPSSGPAGRTPSPPAAGR
jgi:segregation and condensation protein A